MINFPTWVEEYLSIDYEKVNCWGLVQKVYLEQFNIIIGDMHDQRSNLKNQTWLDVIQDGLGFIPGDVLLFKNSMVSKHVGMIITPELMLHTIKGSNSCIERWESRIWRNRLVGIYRHKNLE